MIFPLENRDVKPSESIRKLILQVVGGNLRDVRRSALEHHQSALMSPIDGKYLYIFVVQKNQCFSHENEEKIGCSLPNSFFSPSFNLFLVVTIYLSVLPTVPILQRNCNYVHIFSGLKISRLK